MNEMLSKLTKEDLIKVVANMHDTIQDWNNGWGLKPGDAEIMTKIGSACVSACSDNNDWDLPQVVEKEKKEFYCDNIKKWEDLCETQCTSCSVIEIRKKAE
jgi:hypothetical protein